MTLTKVLGPAALVLGLGLAAPQVAGAHDYCDRYHRSTSSYYSSDYMLQRDYDMDGPYYHATARYLCDSDGDNCHWTHTYRDGFDYY